MGKSSVSYPEKIADQLGLKFERMAQNPKGLQLKELVFKLRPKIEAAQAAGYSLEDVVAVFKAEDVSISVSTLKSYLRDARSALKSGEGAIVPPEKGEAAEVRSGATASKSGTKKQKGSIDAKPELTNTNADGFQEMRSDDDL